MNIDYNAAITTLALVIALGVAVRDSYIRLADSSKRTKIYLSYYRREAELLIQRLYSIKGTLENHKSIRLGASRPYDAFKYSSLIAKKCSNWKSEHQLPTLENLPTKTSLQLSILLGEIPRLISNLEALAFTQAQVTINERDQDLIKEALERLNLITQVVQDLFKLDEKAVQILVNQYCETLQDGESMLQIEGFYKN